RSSSPRPSPATCPTSSRAPGSMSWRARSAVSADRPGDARPDPDRTGDDAVDPRPDVGPDRLTDPTVPVARALGLTPASDVARAALARARAAAEARGLRPGMAPRRRPRPTDTTWSGR